MFEELCMSSRVMVLLSTVREERMGVFVADWVMEQLKQFDGDCSFELVDLKEIDLPLMNEPYPPLMGKPYSFEHTKKWSKIVNGYDGFIFLVAEYNHSYAASLKNAIDYLYSEWKGKPVAYVAYGSSGAERAVRHLWDVTDFMEMRPVHYRVIISQLFDAVNREDGTIKTDFVRGSVPELAKQLQAALKT